MIGYLEYESTAPVRGVKSSSSVHVEYGGEVVRVPVKEVLRRITRGELVTRLQDLLHRLRSHQLAQPGGGEHTQYLPGGYEPLSSHIYDHCPLLLGISCKLVSDISARNLLEIIIIKKHFCSGPVDRKDLTS